VASLFHFDPVALFTAETWANKAPTVQF
jgi:hypothetical protein